MLEFWGPGKDQFLPLVGAHLIKIEAEIVASEEGKKSEPAVERQDRLQPDNKDDTQIERAETEAAMSALSSIL